MYSAEPLPHFVDEYLSYLYEVHPTNATFDGVHLHDDLLEHAKYMQNTVVPAMSDVRGAADRLEKVVADDLWPLPKYSEILFIK